MIIDIKMTQTVREDDPGVGARARAEEGLKQITEINQIDRRLLQGQISPNS